MVYGLVQLDIYFAYSQAKQDGFTLQDKYTNHCYGKTIPNIDFRCYNSTPDEEFGYCQTFYKALNKEDYPCLTELQQRQGERPI